MYSQTDDDGPLSAIHRYFPEWADRPTGPDAQHESDRNSYLAGGYADEFSYGTSVSRPPAITPLDGDPEDSRLWREQIGALHPGYPQCAKPIDRDGPAATRELSPGRPSRSERHARIAFGVIRVRPCEQTPLAHMALRLGFIAFLAERLLRRRRLNQVL